MSAVQALRENLGFVKMVLGKSRKETKNFS